MNAPLEIERKYLITMPSIASLVQKEGTRVFSITQIYLKSPVGMSRRVRKKCEGARTVYIMTEKERVSPLTAIEREREITEAEYCALLSESDPAATPIEKTRYAIPHGRHTLEIDVYPFWDRAAILEIELASEEEEVDIPTYLSVACEVTGDGRFKNAALAKNPDERGALPHLLAPDLF